MIAQEIERQIGLSPNPQNLNLLLALLHNCPGTRDMLCAWLKHQGIKPKSMVKALDRTLVWAYCNKQYRNAWLERQGS